MSDFRASERAFRMLLLLYPRGFRDAYGTDATELFCDSLRDARSRGRAFVLLLWLRTVPNAVWNGSLERIAEVARGGTTERGILLRNGLRGLARSPGLTATIVITLGVGIGANVALYSVLRGVLLRPLPYPEAERLVQLWETNPEIDDELHGPSPWNFVDWEREAEGFESMASWYLTSGTYRTEAWAEELRSAQVTVDFFRTLGVAPMLGRDFQPEEVTRYGPVMLSHKVWQRLFGGDPAVLGQTIVASGSTYEIVGVMPQGFAFPDESVETWVAWDMPTVYADLPESRTWRFLEGLARLPADGTVETAEDELDRIAAGLAEAYPEMDRGWDTEVTSLHEETVGNVRGTLWLAFGSVLFILLIACANVANLLLARVPTRAREIGIRMVLGASRRRVAAELLVENGVLAVVAGVLGLVLGRVFIDLLVALDAGRIPRLGEVSIDLGVFAFTVAVAAATSLIFGIAPIAQAVRASGGGSTRHGTRIAGSRGQRRLRELFVGGQVAIALVLLSGAGLFTASLDRLMTVDPGIDAERVATFRISLDPVEGTEGETVRYYDGLIDRLLEVPGVEAVGASQTLPMSPIGNDFRRPYRARGSEVASADASTVQMRIVTSNYADVVGMTLIAGEDIPESAVDGEEVVAVVNETLANRLWPAGGAVGQTFEIDFREGWLPYRVVGVVHDVKHHGLRTEAGPEAFLAHRQIPYIAMSMVVKTTSAPEQSTEALRAAVLAHQPMQPPHNFVSLEALLSASTAEERFLSVLLSLFAVIGLLLASTGVYGIIAWTVTHRRREIGVRMALGAEPDQLVGSVFRQAVAVTGVGLVAGLAGVAFLGRLIEGLLFGVSASDPQTTAFVAALLTAVSALAAWLPARRAAWVQPSEALRSE